jgi:tRNA pseudouridine38-40 synthase
MSAALLSTRPVGAGRVAPLGDATRHVYALTLEYDGTDFSGWQRQPGRRTVEGALLDALAAVTGEASPLTAAGRTDAGAHAHAQVVGCTLRRAWDCQRLRAALNARLPGDVVVVDVRMAPPGFHARFDAIARTYRYIVAPRRERPAVLRQHAWFVRGEVDVEAMREAARELVGTHDLAAFGRAPRAGGSTVRTVHDVAVRRLAAPTVEAAAAAAPPGALTASASPGAEASVVVIDVTADAFLYGMMRNLAAALVAVGTGHMTGAGFVAMVHGGRRERALTAAPAHGLHQWRVTYSSSKDDQG